LDVQVEGLHQLADADLTELFGVGLYCFGEDPPFFLVSFREIESREEGGDEGLVKMDVAVLRHEEEGEVTCGFV
jgi:hypothetical protein